MDGRSHSKAKFALVAIPVLVLAGQSLVDILGTGEWHIAGQNLNNTWNQRAGREIGTGNIQSLQVKWTFSTAGDVSATPTVAGNVVYVPDWGGNLFALRADNGELIWAHSIAEYDGVSGSVSRVSPAVSGDEVIIGDILNSKTTHNGANVIAVDRGTGALRWITQVDKHPAAIITGSPVVFNNTVYVGVSSNEEGLATDNSYPCCTFRGSMVALNATTGAMLWKTFVVPDNGGKTGGYSGGAIWQPPAVDIRRGLLYVGTGNNYEVPSTVEACQNSNPQGTCTAPDDYFDTALALDLKNGAIRWAKRLQGFDVWTVACTSKPPGVNCPSPSSPDYDLPGSGPNLLPNMVGLGQKSGIYWALNPDNGSILWSAIVGPGSTLGGMEWGTATDGARIYAAIGNAEHKEYTLQPSGTTINWGSGSAIDVTNGHIVWQTADPTQGAMDESSLSVSNGIVYAGSYAGGMYAMDATTGRILWSFASGGSVIDAPSIVNGTLFWGSGYRKIAPGIGNNKVYAFAIP